MELRLYIRRNADRVVCWRMMPGDFQWSEGHFVCDCKRSALFAQAAGTQDFQAPCGHTAYNVRITDMWGNELYRDKEW